MCWQQTLIYCKGTGLVSILSPNSQQKNKTLLWKFSNYVSKLMQSASSQKSSPYFQIVTNVGLLLLLCRRWLANSLERERPLPSENLLWPEEHHSYIAYKWKCIHCSTFFDISFPLASSSVPTAQVAKRSRRHDFTSSWIKREIKDELCWKELTSRL